MTPSTPSGRRLADWLDAMRRLPSEVDAIEAEAGREAVEAYRLSLRAGVVAMTPLQHPPVKGAAVRAWVDRGELLRLIEGEKTP